MSTLSPLLVPAASIALFGSGPPNATTDIFVDASGANCATGTGTAGDPVCSINSAIGLAASGDTIRIAPGIYFEDILIPFDLDLIGTAGASVTTMDGSASPGLVSIVTVPASVSLTIDGLTIRNGTNRSGGAIEVAGSLALMNSSITGNSTTQGVGPSYGGGIYVSPTGTELTVENCQFSDNFARFSGGAIHIENAACTISNSTFDDNESPRGGAIHFIGLDPFTNILEIVDSALTRNRADGTAGPFANGAGIKMDGGRLNLFRSTIEENITTDGLAGGLSLRACQFAITNSTIARNGASRNTYPYISPYTGFGGAINTSAGAAGSITSSTIARNGIANTLGGGVFITGDSGIVTIQNSIFAENEGAELFPYGDDLYSGVPLISLGSNLIGDGGGSFYPLGVPSDLIGSTGNPIDPLLGPIQDNGGPNRTLALLPNSPAIDAGDPIVFEPIDQRGLPRPQGSAPDMGAFESVANRDTVDLCSGDGGDGIGCTPCPCANNALPGTVGGCLNSTGGSGRLLRTGSSFINAADLRFEAQGVPASTAAILLSGTALAPANAGNPCFGQGSGIPSPTLDGLRCVVQGVLRHGIRSANANGEIGVTTNAWGSPSGFFNFGSFMAGQTRFFQAFYRDDLAASCQTGLNTTQASRVTFIP